MQKTDDIAMIKAVIDYGAITERYAQLVHVTKRLDNFEKMLTELEKGCRNWGKYHT